MVESTCDAHIYSMYVHGVNNLTQKGPSSLAPQQIEVIELVVVLHDGTLNLTAVYPRYIICEEDIKLIA